jgi:5-methylcytosine-specific restriction endonuclease McrA
MSKTIPKTLRYKILERDGFKCCACGATNCLEIDHIIPRSKGGATVEQNLQVLCADCNRGKGTKIPQNHPEQGIPIRDLEKKWNLSRNGLRR